MKFGTQHADPKNQAPPNATHSSQAHSGVIYSSTSTDSGSSTSTGTMYMYTARCFFLAKRCALSGPDRGTQGQPTTAQNPAGSRRHAAYCGRTVGLPPSPTPPHLVLFITEGYETQRSPGPFYSWLMMRISLSVHRRGLHSLGTPMCAAAATCFPSFLSSRATHGRR